MWEKKNNKNHEEVFYIPSQYLQQRVHVPLQPQGKCELRVRRTSQAVENTEIKTQGGVSEPRPPPYEKSTPINRTLLNACFFPTALRVMVIDAPNNDLSRHHYILKGSPTHGEKLRLCIVTEQHEHPSPCSNNHKWINALHPPHRKQG